MANALINGPVAEAAKPAASDPAAAVPTWGYRGSEARIFDLRPGERLPKGWVDRPPPVKDADDHRS